MENQFIGRTNELQKLMKDIFTDRPDVYDGPLSKSLTGAMGSGKHTLIKEAKRTFEAKAHPGVFLIEREFSENDTQFTFYWDLIQKLQNALTEEALKPYVQRQDMNIFFDTIREALKDDPSDPIAREKILGKLRNVMKICRKLKIRIILILYSFDTVMTLDKGSWKGIVTFLKQIHQRSACDWYLNTLLVSDIQPQFIASPVTSGSKFQSGYPPIVLHNYSSQEMDWYFYSLPGGYPDSDTREAILQHCGRYPAFLADFRMHVADAQTINPNDVYNWENDFSKEAFFHRIHTLLKKQYVDPNDSISANEVYQKYFFEKDQSQKGLMYERVYKSFGLADIKQTACGTEYTPLTEYCAPSENIESSFLSYMCGEAGTDPQRNIPVTDATVITSWLQLSDLHVSDEPDTEWLLGQFKNLSAKIHPDFIVVTGDFRDKKDKTQFNLAAAYLDKILQFFRITPEDVYLVPGNHDVENATPDQQNTIDKITEKIETDYYAYKNDLPGLYERFSGFSAFCKDFYRDLKDKEDNRFKHPQGTHLYTWNGELNILCANTALISDGKRTCDGKRIHQEIVDLKGINDALKQRDTSIPTIMLGHHDLSSLYSNHKERLDDFFKNNDIRAYLHGDAHKSSNTPAWCETERACPSFGCGKSAPKSGDNYSDYSAVYYEWRGDGKVYIKWFKVYNAFGIRKLDEDRNFGPAMGEDVSFSMILPSAE